MAVETGRGSHMLSDRQERRMRASALLAEETQRLQADAQAWQRWLSLAARLRGLSGRNILLTLAQDPEATDLAGVEQWRRRGRTVRTGELPVVLVAGAGAAELFDVRHTTPAIEGAASDDRVPDPSPDRSADGPGVPEPAPPAELVADVLEAMLRTPPADPQAAGSTVEERAWSAARQLAREYGHARRSRPVSGEPGDPSAAGATDSLVSDAAASIVLASLGMPMPSGPPAPTGVPRPGARGAGATPVSGLREGQVFDTLDAIVSTATTIRSRCLAAIRAGFGESRPVASGTAGSGVSVVEDPQVRLRRMLAESVDWFAGNRAASWVPGYLAGRGLGGDLGSPLMLGYAPPGGARLVAALHRRGFDPEEVRAAGLAATTTRGRLIDRLRDRLVVVVRDSLGPVGFVGRARPGSSAPIPPWIDAGPAELLGAAGHVIGLAESSTQLLAGARPVLVADALDALIVHAAGGDRAVGLAPLGGVWGPGQVASVAMTTTTSPLVLVPGDAAGLASAAALSAADHPQLLGARLALTPDGGPVAHCPAAVLSVLLSEPRLWWPLAAANALRVLRETDPAADTQVRVAACRIAVDAVARVPDPAERLRLSTVITHQLDLPPGTVHTLLREAAAGASAGSGTTPAPMTRVVAGERLTLVDDPDGRCWTTTDGWLLQPGAPTAEGVITYALVRPGGEGPGGPGEALDRYVASAVGLTEAVAVLRSLRTAWLLGDPLAGGADTAVGRVAASAEVLS